MAKRRMGYKREVFDDDQFGDAKAEGVELNQDRGGEGEGEDGAPGPGDGEGDGQDAGDGGGDGEGQGQGQDGDGQDAGDGGDQDGDGDGEGDQDDDDQLKPGDAVVRSGSWPAAWGDQDGGDLGIVTHVKDNGWAVVKWWANGCNKDEAYPYDGICYQRQHLRKLDAAHPLVMLPPSRMLTDDECRNLAMPGADKRTHKMYGMLGRAHVVKSTDGQPASAMFGDGWTYLWLLGNVPDKIVALQPGDAVVAKGRVEHVKGWSDAAVKMQSGRVYDLADLRHPSWPDDESPQEGDWILLGEVPEDIREGIDDDCWELPTVAQVCSTGKDGLLCRAAFDCGDGEPVYMFHVPADENVAIISPADGDKYLPRVPFGEDRFGGLLRITKEMQKQRDATGTPLSVSDGHRWHQAYMCPYNELREPAPAGNPIVAAMVAIVLGAFD